MIKDRIVTMQHFSSLIYELTLFYRTPSREEETLDDIFNKPSRPAFTTTDDDDDLFKQTPAASEQAVQAMNADDIASYIQQNMPDSEAKLDLF